LWLCCCYWHSVAQKFRLLHWINKTHLRFLLFDSSKFRCLGNSLSYTRCQLGQPSVVATFATSNSKNSGLADTCFEARRAPATTLADIFSSSGTCQLVSFESLTKLAFGLTTSTCQRSYSRSIILSSNPGLLFVYYLLDEAQLMNRTSNSRYNE
jgi:hypothetical protein